MKSNKPCERVIKLSLNDRDSICTNYLLGESTKSLSKKYNVTQKAILYTLKNRRVIRRANNVERRKYDLHEDFFDVIDSQEKAYILGLLYADGSNNIKKSSIEITLTEKDKEILDRIAKIIYINDYSLYYRVLNNIIINGKFTKKRKNAYRLIINNKHMSDTLNNLGMIANKTKKLKFPEAIQKAYIATL